MLKTSVTGVKYFSTKFVSFINVQVCLKENHCLPVSQVKSVYVLKQSVAFFQTPVLQNSIMSKDLNFSRAEIIVTEAPWNEKFS